mmetsp:Transcript_32998/g.105123  ORF Transcript_32998/g.105123 Transcript_32998/m.105123 type:complete len:217 (-) Transcript_32998:2343-2993(-)
MAPTMASIPEAKVGREARTPSKAEKLYVMGGNGRNPSEIATWRACQVTSPAESECNAAARGERRGGPRHLRRGLRGQGEDGLARGVPLLPRVHGLELHLPRLLALLLVDLHQEPLHEHDQGVRRLALGVDLIPWREAARHEQARNGVEVGVVLDLGEEPELPQAHGLHAHGAVVEHEALGLGEDLVEHPLARHDLVLGPHVLQLGVGEHHDHVELL